MSCCFLEEVLEFVTSIVAEEAVRVDLQQAGIPDASPKQPPEGKKYELKVEEDPAMGAEGRMTEWGTAAK